MQLSESTRTILLQIKKDEQDWYPDMSSLWSHEMEYGRRNHPAIDLRRNESRSKEFEIMFGKDLSCFKNIDQLRYIFDSNARLGRYHDIGKPGLDGELKNVAHTTFECWGSTPYAHLGFNIIVTACMLSDIRPRVLEIAVDSVEHHAFNTTLPEKTLSAVCNRVENLRLVDSLSCFYDRMRLLETTARIVVTKELFPLLRSLTIDHLDCESRLYERITPLPSPANVPKITHLTIKGSSQSKPTLLAFVTCYGQSLERATLEGIPGDTYVDMLHTVKPFGLKALKIKHLDNWYRNEHLMYNYARWINELLESLQEDCIKDVAEDIILEPEWLVRAMEEFEESASEADSDSGDEVDVN
jgi:hypothetical protein